MLATGVGHCESDEDCQGTFVCFKQTVGGRIPGCDNDFDPFDTNWCVKPNPLPSMSPSLHPSHSQLSSISVVPSVHPTVNQLPSTSTMPSKLSNVSKELALWALEVFKQVSKETALEDTSSPQYKAYKWIVGNYEVSSSSESQLLQQYALACLYFSLTPNSNPPPGDSGKRTECSWAAIECNKDNQVMAIKMAGLNLQGFIPPEIGILSSLTMVDLSDNKIQGRIPEELWTLIKLQSIYLHNNQLTGPAISDDVGKLENLEYLYLGNNQLTGTIPQTLRSASTGLSRPLRKYPLFCYVVCVLVTHAILL